MKSEKMPKVSVIIPTRGRYDKLKKAIKSVLDQTFQEFEILIIDGNDNKGFLKTKEICKSFDDNRIHIIKQQKQGIADARNCGLENAIGNYIAFLDDDDVFLPKKLEKHVKILDKSSEDVVLTYSQHYGVDRENNYKVITPTQKEGKSGYIYDYMLKRYFEKVCYPSILFQIWDAVIKKRFIQDMRFDERLAGPEDDFLLRLAKKGKFIFINEVLHVQYLEGERLSSPASLPSNFSLMDIIYKKHSKYMAKKGIKYNRSARISLSLLVRGTKFIRRGEIREGRKMLFQAMKLKPSLYSLLAFISSFFGKSFFIEALRIRQKLRG